MCIILVDTQKGSFHEAIEFTVRVRPGLFSRYGGGAEDRDRRTERRQVPHRYSGELEWRPGNVLPRLQRRAGELQGYEASTAVRRVYGTRLCAGAIRVRGRRMGGG